MNMTLGDLFMKLPEIFLSVFPQDTIFPGFIPSSIGHYWTIIQNDYLVKYI